MNTLVGSETKIKGEELVKEYIRTGNPRLKDKIVSSFAPLVKHIIGRFNVTYSTTLDREDLYHAGVFGLLKALEKFNPESGTPFRTYAYKRIHGEVVDMLRKEGMLGRDKYDQVKRLEKTIAALTSRLGYEPSTDEICREMGISDQEYHSLISTAQMVYTTSLNTKINGNDGDFIYRIDTLKDDDRSSPEDDVIKSDLKDNLRKLIQGLPDREKLILALYFYEELTLADIGKVVNLTEARISQILNKTLVSLRARLQK